VFVGQACLDKGLADQFGSFDDAVALAQQLAASSAPSTTTSSTMGIFGNKNPMPATMLALVGAAAVTPEQATAANAELAAGGITGATLVPSATLTELQTKATAHDAALQAQAMAEGKVTAMTEALTMAGAPDVPTLAKDRDEWKTKAETYGSQPGQMGTNAKKEGDDMGEPSAASAAQKAIDTLAHNAALDNHPLFGGK
jgi:ClpP class serine protease